MLILMIRSVILYAVIIAAIRLMGKKQLGEFQPSELVTTILISNIATMSIEDPSLPMLIGIVPILMILCIDVLMSVIMMKSTRFRRAVTGSPCVLISEGIIDQEMMKKLRYTIDDLLEAMREQQIFDISEVRYAIAETTGKINFLKKTDADSDPPCVIIKDGFTDDRGIARAKLDDKTLTELLRRLNRPVKDIFLMTADKNAKIELIPKQKKEDPTQ